MATTDWKTKRLLVTNLFLDDKNPRLGKKVGGRTSQEIIQYFFDHYKALDIAKSIATRGFLQNEPLLAIPDGRHWVVVEGNRRLAALKTLKEPSLLTDKFKKKVEQLARQIDSAAISRIPVTIAPKRSDTDHILAARHFQAPVLAWKAESRANFVLSKLKDGYKHTELYKLGFTKSEIKSEIEKAKLTSAIVETVEKLGFPIDGPGTKLLSTIERVFDSSVGRKHLKVELDPNHGFRGKTTEQEFLRAFGEFLKDITRGKATSRTLNTNDDIRNYFEKQNPKAIAVKKKGSFMPEDITSKPSTPSPKPSPRPRPKPESLTVLPKDFKVVFGNSRLKDIREELVKLKRNQSPNAGAVLLRVFLELAIKDYLERTGQIDLSNDPEPKMKKLKNLILSVAEAQLGKQECAKVKKALHRDPDAPFSLDSLHAFVHGTDLPSERDIKQFWERTEPLFRLMLEQEPKKPTQ